MSAGHRQIDHTADLALEIWAPTEAALLNEGARAMIGLLAPDATVATTDTRTIELQPLDPEDRLVQWLSEVVFLAAVEGFVVADAELDLSDGGLRGTLRGQADASDLIVSEIKAITYHDLVLRDEGDRWFARIVLDV